MAQSDPSPRTTSSPPAERPAARRSRRMLSVGLVVAGLLLFSVLLFRLVGPKPVPPLKVIHYTPQQAADARSNLNSLGAQLLDPSPAASPTSPEAPPPPAGGRRAISPARQGPVGAPAPVRLQLSQTDLNTYLATDPKVKALLSTRGIQAVQLSLQAPHAVTCRAAVLYKGRRTNVQITGDLLPSRDTVARFVATKAQVGALPLPPGVVTAQANRIAGQFLGRMHGRFPVDVRSIEVVRDHLILTGVRLTPRKH